MALFGAGVFSTETAARVLGLAVGAAGIVVCGVVRDLGRRLEPGLWESWGGSPTVRRMRFRGASDDAAVARLHARIEAVTDFALPTQAEEAAAPEKADAMYEEAVAELREFTRDHSRFPLVFAENAEYGFRRNALGVRWIGFALSVVAVAVSAGVLVVAGRHDGGQLARWLVPGCLGIACAAFWLLVVRPPWVRRASEFYAERLLEAVVTLRSADS